jgi:hypothetical protein
MPQMLTLELPDSIYKRFKRRAEATEQSVEEVIMKTLSASLPPSPDEVSSDMQQELLAIESLNDDELWQVAQSTMSKDKLRKWKHLMEKNTNGVLTQEEQCRLNAFVTEADRITLRKAHAYALLKWRGYRLPTLEEMQKKK